MRSTKERLQQMAASEEKNRENIRAYVDCESYRSGKQDRRDWEVAHYEKRLAELMAKGAHITHPWITDRYEADVLSMSKHAEGRETE